MAIARLGRSIPACAGEPRATRYRSTCGGVYPRVCGGTKTTIARHGWNEGLSPRVRGNRWWTPPAGRPAGSIPACAGEPLRGQFAHRDGQVYPRVCGGTLDPFSAMVRGEGLSPRVRGNHAERGDGRTGSGSIPACAGEPRSRWSFPGGSEVYPRVCGGTTTIHAETEKFWGLSPRVRGNHAQRVHGCTGSGSIPACAGEPRRCRSRRRVGAVYPRVCGGTNLQ